MSNTQITTRRAAAQMSLTSGLYALANNPAFQRLVTNGLNSLTGKILIPMKTIPSGTPVGIRSFAAFMGYKSTNYDWDLSNSSQLSNLMNVFQYQTLKRVQFHWRPSTAYTTAGVVAMCVNSDTTATSAATSLQSIIQKDGALSGDVKDAHTFVYVPRTEQERETKLSRDASGVLVTDQRFYTPGIFWIRYETNITTNDTIVGYMEQEVTVTLERLE